MKFYSVDVEKDIELGIALHELAFAYGYNFPSNCSPGSRGHRFLSIKRGDKYLFVSDSSENVLTVKDWIGCLKGNWPARTIEIDGKKIELSEESFQKLRESLYE